MTTEINPSNECLASFKASMIKAANDHPLPWSLAQDSGVWIIRDVHGKQVCTSTGRVFAEKFMELAPQICANFPEGFMPPDPEFS